jgi:hypothetical protein
MKRKNARVDGDHITVGDISYRFKTPKYVIVNKWDRALQPIRVFLPKPPDVTEVEGFDRHPREQYFRPTKLPEKLLQLEERLMEKFRNGEIKEGSVSVKYSRAKLILYIWDEIRKNYLEYKDEIAFIKKELMKCIYGAWYMIDTEITYFPPWYYFYVNYYTLEGMKPAYKADEFDQTLEYRDRDRIEFIFDEYLYKTDEDQYYRSTGSRTFYGKCNAKHRRGGATSKALAQLMWVKLFVAPVGGSCGIQANEGSTAESNFAQRLIPSYVNMPFYLQALWSGSDMPKDRMRFDSPSTRLATGKKTLGGIIDFATTKEGSFYDGKKQYYHLSDENGKLRDVDANERLGVVLPTLEEGANIKGFIALPSTVEEMDSRGGAEFYQLNEQSSFYDRDKMGRTKTGLARYFDTAVNGFGGYVDIFGKGVIFDPDKKDMWKIKGGKTVGSLTHITSRRKKLEESGKVDDKDVLIQYKQRFPIEYMEAFSNSGGGVGFDDMVLSEQMNDLRLMDAEGRAKYRRANLLWEKPDGTRLTPEEFVGLGYHRIPNITDSWNVIVELNSEGSIIISKLPSLKNAKQKKGKHWYPMMSGVFTASNDTFTHYTEREKGSKVNRSKTGTSKGALTVFWEMEESDKQKDVAEMESYRFVLSYLDRPSDDVFNEICLMACVLYGADMFPENNIDNTIKWFEDRGYLGYLLYDVDVSTGKPKPKAGFKAGSETKQRLFKLLANYIKNHARRTWHPDIVGQWVAIKNIEDMTHYDLITSTGGCLLGSESRMREYKQEMSKPERKLNLLDYYSTY